MATKTSAYSQLLDALRDAGSSVIEHGDDKATAQCPAHADGRPSLSVTRIEGSVLLYCHASCDTADVLSKLGLDTRDLYDNRRGMSHAYVDGRVTHRSHDKKFRQSGNTKGSSLFRADRIANVDTVYVVEGEKDVLAVEVAGAAAVCNAMGAGKAHRFDWSPLAGKHAVVVADKDEPGRKHAHEVAQLLHAVAASVKIVEAAVGKDAADHIAAGRGLDELVDAPLYPSDFGATPQQSWSDLPEPLRTLAATPRILDQLADEVGRRGLVGEERLAQTLYLVLTSRLLDKPASAAVKGHSSSGKSFVVETVAKFFPDKAFYKFTAMSQRALVYSTEEFKHRTLIMYEVTAMREGVQDDLTSYLLRSLLSEGRLDYDVTTRAEDGGFTTKRISKEGPTNLIFTTTKTRVHDENETRILSLATDDSPAQTARVLLALADEQGGGDLRHWRDLQAWLAAGERRVTIPYAKALAKLIPPAAVRLRRDFGTVLALIRAHALLHQATRDRDDGGRIIATIDDYATIRDLVADTIAEGVGHDVPDTVRETVAAVRALQVRHQFGVTVRQVADELKIDKSNASRRLRVAADGGYLRNMEEKRGMPARWKIEADDDPLPESSHLLPAPPLLRNTQRNTFTSPDQDCCGVAPKSEGYRGDDGRGGQGTPQNVQPEPPPGAPTSETLGYTDHVKRLVAAATVRVGNCAAAEPAI